MKKLGILFAVLILAAGAYHFTTQKTLACGDKEVPQISKMDLQEKINSGDVFVVDVNSAESFKENHIPTAVHFDTVKTTFAQALPPNKEKLIVAYCGGPMCGAWKKAANAACDLGYTNLAHYKGGITGWLEN